jgi:hypothetical protein
MKSSKINRQNHFAGIRTPDDAVLVKAVQYNAMKEDLDALRPSDINVKADTVSEVTSAAGVTVDGVLLKDTYVQATNLKTVLATLTATEIVGNSAGDLAHTAGAVLVPAAAAGYIHEFVSATLILDFGTAAYTGGGSDLTVRVGTVAQCAAIAAATLVGASADAIVVVNKLATNTVETGSVAGTINLFAGTAFTQPGTAAGVLRCYVTYRTYPTGL